MCPVVVSRGWVADLGFRIAIPSVYYLAVTTTWLGDDPMVWFVMMLMPVGPPAMMLSALMELKGAPDAEKMAVARVLTVSHSRAVVVRRSTMLIPTQ